MQKVSLFFILIGISCGILSGCGPEMTITKVNGNDSIKGFRYYRPHPYLLVTYDPNGNPNSEILWLPNTEEEYAINANSNFGKVEFNLTFADGWKLTQVGHTSDSKVQETIQAFGGVLKEVVASGVLVQPLKGKIPTGPRLYRFHFDENKGWITKLIEIQMLDLPQQK